MIVTKALFITLIFVTNLLRFEMAVTPAEKQKGMMYRETWGNLDGMIFVNEAPQTVSFWMKNTSLNMALWYMDSNLNILETYYPAPFSTDAITSKSGNILYVLELNPAVTNSILRDYAVFRKKLYGKLIKLGVSGLTNGR